MQPDNPTAVTRHRLKPHQRRDVIIDAGVFVALAEGDVLALTMRDVASRCRVHTSPETVKYHFGTIDRLRDAVGAAMRR